MEDGRCLFCLRSDGGFVAREHIIPESLGNTELVLPPGVVCDRCNNGVLSDLDQTLCEFFPVKMRRTILGVSSKSGLVPSTRFMTGTLANRGGGRLQIEVNRASDTKTFRETSRDGDTVNLSLETKGGAVLTPRYIARVSRALLKQGLEFAWLDLEGRSFDTRLDHVRRAVLGDPYSGFLAINRKADPDHLEVSVTFNVEDHHNGDLRLWVHAKIYGVELVTDSRLDDLTGVPPEAVNVLQFANT